MFSYAREHITALPKQTGNVSCGGTHASLRRISAPVG